MSSESITGVVGIASAAVGALGLLLAWYRHDATPPKRPGRGRRSRRGHLVLRARVAALSAVAIVGAATVGIYLSVGAPPAPTPGTPTGGAAPTLTEAQYKARLSQACLESAEEAGHIEEADPKGQLLGANIDVEQHLVERIDSLRPPRSLTAVHDDLVATWEQRLALLRSLYERIDSPDDSFETDLRRTVELAGKVSDLATSLGTPECGF